MAPGTFDDGRRAGGSVVRHDLTDVQFTFPAWSPDGAQIAATGAGPGGSGVYVVPVEAAGPGHRAERVGRALTSDVGRRSRPSADPSQPVAVYLSQPRPAFYVYWTPNSHSMGFLSSDPSGSIQLRLAPADASSESRLVRQGSPMYWSWVDDATLFVHAGGGTAAFLGEVGPTGDPAGTSDPVDGRATSGRRPSRPAESSGRMWVAAPTITRRSSSSPASPTATLEARPRCSDRRRSSSIRPATPSRSSPVRAADSPETDLPVGPLKVVDARSGAVRMLLPGSVIGFFWSPDGRSIAALRVGAGGTPATAQAAVFHRPNARTPSTATTVAQLSPNVAPIATAGLDLDLTFVDPADGTIRSERSIRLADVFTNQVLPYFDQYALSHRVWSADGKSIALPVVGTDGSSEIRVYSADGSTDTKVAVGRRRLLAALSSLS